MRAKKVLSLILVILLILSSFSFVFGTSRNYKIKVSSTSGGYVEYNGDVSPKSINVNFDDVHTFTAIPDSGYEFIGWKYNSNDTYTDESNEYSVYNPNGNKIDVKIRSSKYTKNIRAKFAIKRYTVNFNANGGTLSGKTSFTNVKHGKSIKPPKVSPPYGYIFDGWDNDAYTNVTDNLIINAKYKPITYTITFLPGEHGTINGTTTQSVEYDSTTIPPTVNPDAGYEFIGWSGGFDSTTPITGELTLTAQYSKLTYIVNFNPNGGTLSGQSSFTGVEHGSSLTPPIVTAPYGHIFDKWDSDEYKNVAKNLTINANYNFKTYTVKFFPGDHGTLNGTTTQSISYKGSAESPEAIPFTGYEFSGWSNNDYNNVTTDTAVTAQYEIKKYTVVFNVGDGSTSDTVIYYDVPHGSSVATPIITAPNGYSFIDWDSSSYTNVTSDLIINAQYRLKTYSVTFLPGNHGTLTGETTQNINHGSYVAKPEVNSDTGYHFIGWSDGFDPDSIPITANTTVTALYEKNTYPLIITVTGNGKVDKNIDAATYDHGTTVTLTANPDLYSKFVGWSGDINSTSSSIDIDMTEAKSITATFEDYKSINLSVGHVTENVDGTFTAAFSYTNLNDENIDTSLYEYNTLTGSGIISSTATPKLFEKGVINDALIVTFDGSDITWSLTGPDGNISNATANADDVSKTMLSVNIISNGDVSINSDKDTYDVNESVTLTAIADPNHHFIKWSGNIGNANPNDLTINVPMDESRSIVAHFAIDTFNLDINIDGNGSVIINPEKDIYDYGTKVTLTADQGAYRIFSGWSGNLDYLIDTNNETITITMDQDIEITAKFTYIPIGPTKYQVTFNSGSHGEIINSNLSKQIVSNGESAQDPSIEAKEGWKFTGWNKSFDNITKSIVVNATYSEIEIVDEEETPQDTPDTPDNVSEDNNDISEEPNQEGSENEEASEEQQGSGQQEGLVGEEGSNQSDIELDQEVPYDEAKLPNTGGVNVYILYSLGSGLIAVGFLFNNKKK